MEWGGLFLLLKYTREEEEGVLHPHSERRLGWLGKVDWPASPATPISGIRVINLVGGQ